MDLLFAIESGELKLKNYQLDQWRLMHIGAQPVPSSLIKEWQKIFPDHQYDTNYGLTESTGPGCIHLGMDNMHKVGAIGVPGFDWEFPDCRRPAAPGPPGKPRRTDPQRTRRDERVLQKSRSHGRSYRHDGWLLTGDVARQDEEGFIWLVDRKKDVIITGGENIYPVEIEDFLMGHPKIQDVAVIGLPSLRWAKSPRPSSR
jgi:acyl-CoA synthetase (AMP-forming)/AMP-acid ligase II